jgi:hypothetical protein
MIYIKVKVKDILYVALTPRHTVFPPDSEGHEMLIYLFVNSKIEERRYRTNTVKSIQRMFKIIYPRRTYYFIVVPQRALQQEQTFLQKQVPTQQAASANAVKHIIISLFTL